MKKVPAAAAAAAVAGLDPALDQLAAVVLDRVGQLHPTLLGGRAGPSHAGGPAAAALGTQEAAPAAGSAEEKCRQGFQTSSDLWSQNRQFLAIPITSLFEFRVCYKKDCHFLGWLHFGTLGGYTLPQYVFPNFWVCLKIF